ncbi:hypothetical protein [Tistrella mobilis]|uniref:Uncharacterized protein n=1 Tax=Tistrella mobilis (strain KA081020-065) TaxID=1110502 RepID=I3TR81_TISMK|nr:hypothetical protein [Tistrella mobilis]AFK55269.1 hypothetical protein TMO_3431 [Tistrella mobilis KA081020-065]
MFVDASRGYRYDTPAWAGGEPARTSSTDTTQTDSARADRSTTADKTAQAEPVGFWGEDGFSFGDLLDIVNPLQQLPVVGTVYRALTGDTISPGARMIGGIAFGGPIGAIGAMMENATMDASGHTAGDRALAALIGEDEDTGGTALAAADAASGRVESAADDGARIAASQTASLAAPAGRPVGAKDVPAEDGDQGMSEAQFAALLGAFGAAAPAAANGNRPAGGATPDAQTTGAQASIAATADRAPRTRSTTPAEERLAANDLSIARGRNGRPSEREIEAMLRQSVPAGSAGSTPLADLPAGSAGGNTEMGRIIPAAAFMGVDGPTARKPAPPVSAPGAAAYAARTAPPRPREPQDEPMATDAARAAQLQDMNAAAPETGPIPLDDFAARMNQALDRYQAQMRAGQSKAATVSRNL